MTQEEIQQEFNKLHLEQAEISYRLGDAKAYLAELHSKMRALAHKLQELKASEKTSEATTTEEVSA